VLETEGGWTVKRWTFICLLVILVVLGIGGTATAQGSKNTSSSRFAAAGGINDIVTDWNQTMLQVFATANTPAPPGTRLGAIVQASVFDAVNGIERRYTPIHVEPAAPPGASRAAAAASAAHEALVTLFPGQQAMLDAKLAASLTAINGSDQSESIARGLAWGKTVADAILAWRATDGFSTVLLPYVPGTLPGDWQPTPPGFSTQPLFRTLAITTPWALTSPAQFRPVGPPALTSTRYAADFNEVQAFGSLTGSLRTPWQTETALFWGSDAVTAFWDRVADQLSEARNLTLSDDARLLARLNMALSDAAISVWDAKNAFNTWRPVTAIGASWTPLLVTPPFQEYPSGHSGVSSAAATVLASVFGNNSAFTVTSAGLPGVERSFTNFSDAVAQIADARVWGGIHFRFACDDASQQGAEVAQYVNQTMLLRAHG
jgi:hypothetical protein